MTGCYHEINIFLNFISCQSTSRVSERVKEWNDSLCHNLPHKEKRCTQRALNWFVAAASVMVFSGIIDRDAFVKSYFPQPHLSLKADRKVGVDLGPRPLLVFTKDKQKRRAKDRKMCKRRDGEEEMWALWTPYLVFPKERRGNKINVCQEWLSKPHLLKPSFGANNKGQKGDLFRFMNLIA